MPLLVTVLCSSMVAASCGRPADTLSTSDPAVAWDVTVLPLPLPTGAGSAQPQLTRSERGIVLSWLEHSGPTAALKFAERTADGWSEPRTVASGDDWFVSWADVPSVLRMSDGTLVAHWYTNTDVLLEAYDLWLSYSNDDGNTWAEPFAPHDDGTTTQHGFASLFEIPGEGLGLVWLDGRAMELDTDSPGGGAMSMRYAAFDASWRQVADSEVDGRVCECCPTSAVVTPDGVVTAFRDRSLREIRDIHVSRLEKGTWTYPRPVHVDNWRIPACPVNGPSLSASGTALALAWFTAHDDRPQAFGAFSSDAGRTWGPPIRLDDQASLGHVDIEMLDDGAAAATWVEFTDQRARFHLRRIHPSGAVSPGVDVAAGMRVSGYPRMARHGDELVFAWVEGDAEEGGQRVKGAAARLPRPAP